MPALPTIAAYGAGLLATLVLAAFLTPRSWWRRANARALAVLTLGTLGIGIVLARVLGPESFGTFAVALVALMAVLSFNELGVSLAIVRWPGDPARIVPTVNTISAAGSVVYLAIGIQRSRCAVWHAPRIECPAAGTPHAGSR